MAKENGSGNVALWVSTAASVAALMLTPAFTGNPAATSPNIAETKVWYNRLTGFYHTGHCRFYMQTKEGLMLQVTEARQLGHACATCFNPPRARKTQAEKRNLENRILVVH